ncbi:MAG: class I SAM-dependent methyltransferase [Nocardioides sp.]|nr:class I SAM-dependent methyltransferase [Nocardioides sp.]
MRDHDSFSPIFAAALRGGEARLHGLGDLSRTVPVPNWTRDADPIDREFLAHCDGATIDIGCGPGRMAAALAETGATVLGIDIVVEAVEQTLGRGAAALRRNVFERVPGEGRWDTALLADGNVGIGGDPAHLLNRVRQVIDPRGRIVMEVAAPGVGSGSWQVSLECDGRRSAPFSWAVVDADDVADLAAEAGLRVACCHPHDDRWCVLLEAA